MCANGYENLEEPTSQVKLALGITFLLSIIFGALGNVVVLIIVSRVLSSRQTVHNVLILVLALTDLLTICLAFPPAILRYFSGLNVAHAPLCNYQGTLLNFFYVMSVILVSLMSLDRYLALCKPFFYKNHSEFDYRKVITALGILCFFALMISLLPVFGVGTIVLQYPKTFCLFQLNAKDGAGKFVFFLNFSLLLISMLTVVFCNSAVSWTSMRMLERSQQHRPSIGIEQTGSSFSICSTEECQFLKLSLIVMATFLGFWSLFLVRILMIQVGAPFNSCLDIISVHLVTFHTVCNPWIYLLTRRQYRRGFRHIIQVFLHYITCKKLCLTGSSLEYILGIADGKFSDFGKKNEKAGVFDQHTSPPSRSSSWKSEVQESNGEETVDISEDENTAQ